MRIILCTGKEVPLQTSVASLAIVVLKNMANSEVVDVGGSFTGLPRKRISVVTGQESSSTLLGPVLDIKKELLVHANG
jgi:hypothetical protein